jgi:hypothetical protein
MSEQTVITFAWAFPLGCLLMTIVAYYSHG